MKESDHHEPQHLFLAALQCDSPEERERYLEEVCGQDTKRREAVSQLLEAYEEGEGADGEMPGFVPGTVIADRYRIVTALGRGGMGEVYRAEDLKLKQRVALKFLPRTLSEDARLRDALFNEVRQARRVTHRHVCRVHDITEADTGTFLSMEFISGEDLASLLRRIGRLPRDKALELGRQLCQGLAAAHEEDLLHLDLKPANLMIDERGALRITDFGLARLTEDITGAGLPRAGTPAYMAPEQLLGGVPTRATDLYAVGLILHEMLSGAPLHHGRRLKEIIAWHSSDPTPELNEAIPKSLRDLIAYCLAPAPEARPPSVRAILDALELADESEPTMPAAEPSALDPDEIRQSDVLISFAPVDDRSTLDNQQGWISQLHRNLELRVAQISGKRVAVVKQPDVKDEETFETQVLEEVPSAKTVVSILSPPFVQANNCRKLVHRFWEQAASDDVPTRELARLFNVVKTPVENEEMPDDIRSIYSELVPYEFFDRDPETGRIRIFDESFGGLAIQRFHERVYDVAYDLSQILKYLEDEAPSGQGSTSGKTIFLAATTSDIAPERDQLRRELTELGHRVLPRQTFPLIASEMTPVIEQCLDEADLAIHFVGAYYGLVPEATDLSVIALQNQVTAEYSRRKQLPRIIWMPKGLETRDARQSIFLQQLESDPIMMTGAELVVDTLENLKVLLRARWQKESKPSPGSASGEKANSASADAPRLYLICDERDQEAIEPLEDFFYEQGIEVSLPGFEADESEVQEIHLQNLRDCDAALIFYGAAGMHWVDFNIRDLQKASGYRGARPIKVTGVYVAPPFNRRKERFKSVSVDLYRQEGDAFQPGLLGEFIETLRQVKEEEAATT